MSLEIDSTTAGAAAANLNVEPTAGEPVPPIIRSYLDDIDEDDGPTTTSNQHTNRATSTRPSPNSSSSGRSTSGVDDIDGDDDPLHQATTNSTWDDDDHDANQHKSTTADDSLNKKNSSTTTSSSTRASPSPSPPPSSAAAEVQRILNVLAADAALAADIPPPPADSPLTSASFQAQPNHFAVLGLPQPEVNLVGHGVWAIEDQAIKQAFRRLVLLIHPDKNPGEGAKQAFEAVKLANTVLGSDVERYDYIKNYTIFRRNIDQRRPDFLPPSVVATSLTETLEQGRKIADLKKKHSDSITNRLLAQQEAKRQAILDGEAKRRKQEEERRKEELKRKVMDSDKSDASDEDEEELSVAEKIRRAKQGKTKKFRVL